MKMLKAQAKSKEQAELAEEMLKDAKEEIEKCKSRWHTYKIKNCWNQVPQSIILEASLIKNRIHLEKAKMREK